MAKKKLFQGSGGGGPTTTPDSLLSEDIVEFALAVSEGPIRGLTKGAYSFYVGETPLVSEGGGRNFEKFAIGVHPGYPEGSAKPLDLKLGGISSNFTVGVNLLQNVAVTRQTQAQLRNQINQIEVRLQLARLLRTNDEGSTYRNTAKVRIEYRQASSSTWKLVSGAAPIITDPRPPVNQDFEDNQPEVPPLFDHITITGKTTTGYSHEVKFEVPLVNDDWVIRVTKLSPDNHAEDIVDISWESYQSTNRTKLTFPDTAIVHGLGVANGQFSSIPDLGGIYDGLMIRVPTNYNPDTRTYDESTPWNGAFKFAWTNNPAWVLYDMIVNDRYGLAKHRRYLDANRFSFYQAAKWCDQLVPVFGTDIKRPRFTFNMQLNEPRPGLEMLNYVAGSFNGLVWDDLQGQIHLRVDKDDPAVMMFTPENITEEGFQYTFTDLSSRANDVSVAFINPDLDWNEDRRRVPNVTTSEEHIEKYGRIPMDFIAVGCTDVNEAVAKAQIRLISALTETTTVSFQTMRQGALLELYDVILLSDPDMGWSQSGRLTTYDSQWINFRDPIFIETMEDYVLRLQAVDKVVEIKVRPEKIGHVTRLRLLSELPANLPRYTVFTIEGTSSSFGFAKPFRVMSLAESEGNPYVYTITAVEINRNKYQQVEGAPTDLGEFDYSTKFPYLPGQPTAFTATSGDDQIIVMPTGEVIARIFCSWRKPFSTLVRGYVLQYKLVDDGDTDWQTLQPLTTSEYIAPAIAGRTYTLRLASVDANGKQSAWVTIKEHLVKGKSKTPPVVADLQATGEVFQIKLKWSYGSNPPPDLVKVELWANSSSDINSAFKLTDLAYPATEWTHLGLGVDVEIHYWIRVQDSFKNYSPWTGPASARTIKDPTAILDNLEGSINETAFIGKLNDRINLIDAPATTIGSVAARMLDESKARDAAILNEKIARVTATEAIASELDAVATKTDNNLSAIQEERTARTNAIKAEALTRNEQLAEFNGDIRSYVQNYTYSKSDADQAINDVYTTVSSEYKNFSQSLVQNYTYTKAEADAAITGKVDQVTARLNDIGGVTIEQAMTTTADAITGIRGEYSIKIDSGGRVVGFGLLATQEPGGPPDSIFAVVADKFAIAYPGQETKYPFMVGMVNGQSTIGVNGNMIIDGTLVVKAANIENASITTLKLAGETVSIPVVSTSPDIQRRGRGEGQWIIINEGYMKLDQAAVIYILVTAAQGFDKVSNVYWGFEIRVNGQPLRGIMGRQANDAPAMSLSIGLQPGTHFIEVAWSAAKEVIQGYCELYMSCVKR